MSTRREFLQHAAAVGVAVTATCSQAAQTAVDSVGESKGLARVGKAGGASRARIKVVRREETIVRHSVNGDNWNMSWAKDDRQYVSLCDGGGFADQPKAYYNSRMLAVSGGPLDAKFHDLPGYPMLGMPTQRPKDTRYYNFGTLALDNCLYQFMSTFNRQIRPDELQNVDPNNLLRFTGAKLVYSPDNGHTWHNQDGSTPVTWEPWDRRSRETMVFFEEDQEAFSILSVLQMGKNYEHNRDGYVYVYAPNGNIEGKINELVMFRVPKTRILNRGAYEYFVGMRMDGSAKWSKDINGRRPIHTFPRGWANRLWHPYAWHPSVAYVDPLGVYLMANWGMGTGTNVDPWSGIKADDLWFANPSYLGFWIAPNPWGPWTQIHEESAWLPGGDAAARAYEPQIAPKWISMDGKSFWLVWTDFQVTNREEMKRIADERKRNAAANSYSEADVERRVQMMRKYMPYYSFNAQRVDLVVK